MCGDARRSSLCDVSLLRKDKKQFTDLSDYGIFQTRNPAYPISEGYWNTRKKTFHGVYWGNEYIKNISKSNSRDAPLNIFYKYCQPNVPIKAVFFWLFTYWEYTYNVYSLLIYHD